LKKVYLNSCSFFSWNEISWELFENYIQSTFDLEYFWREWWKEVDFVDYKSDFLKAIEVKYKSDLKKEDFSWLKTFNTNFKVNQNLIITKDLDKNFDWVEAKSFYSFLI
jgi:predicted AAA+ superfamily ATPase